MKSIKPPLGRRTVTPMLKVGEMRLFGTRFLKGVDGIIHADEIIKEISFLTNAMYGTNLLLRRIHDVEFYARLGIGEWVGLLFKLERVKKHRIGATLDISFFARRIKDSKDMFSGGYRIRLL